MVPVSPVRILRPVPDRGNPTPDERRRDYFHTQNVLIRAETMLQYGDGANKSVDISATFGYLGSTSTTLGLADYSALSGWDNNWAPASSSTGDWTVSGVSAFSASPCTEGASFKTAAVNGTF